MKPDDPTDFRFTKLFNNFPCTIRLLDYLTSDQWLTDFAVAFNSTANLVVILLNCILLKMIQNDYLNNNILTIYTSMITIIIDWSGLDASLVA